MAYNISTPDLNKTFENADIPQDFFEKFSPQKLEQSQHLNL